MCQGKLSRNYAHQIQVLELICSRETSAVYNAGGMRSSLQFITQAGERVFKDTIASAMAVVTKCCRCVPRWIR